MDRVQAFRDANDQRPEPLRSVDWLWLLALPVLVLGEAVNRLLDRRPTRWRP